jgi:hypothetical protein
LEFFAAAVLLEIIIMLRFVKLLVCPLFWLQAEALSLEELDWMMPHCTLQGNQQVFVDAVREVPQLPPLPQTPVLPEPVMMPWLGRVVNSGSLKVKGNQEAILPVETFLDAFVVPDLGTQQQQQSSQFLKRRWNF